MRRVVRWLRQLLAGRKDERGGGLEVSHVGSGWSDGPEKEKRRWSFAKQRKSGGGGARSSGPDAVAPAAAVERSQLVGRPGEDARAREHRAAIAIQKTFRGYLVRSAIEPSFQAYSSRSLVCSLVSYVREEYCLFFFFKK
jgi:hypothetical protein